MMALRVDFFPFSLPVRRPLLEERKTTTFDLISPHYYQLHTSVKAEREGQLRLARAKVRRELITLDSGVTGPLSRRRIGRDTQRSAAAPASRLNEFFSLL